MEYNAIVGTGAAALLFALTFLFGERVRPLQWLWRNDRGVISFGAGMAVAYVFVHVMPELAVARREFAKSASELVLYEGKAIYFFALVGFLVFYGLAHLLARLRASANEEREKRAFRLNVGGFAAYVCLVGYLLVRSLEQTAEATLLYAVAVAFHFLAVDRSLHREHGVAYERTGRLVLAAMCVLGWATGLLVGLPHGALAVLVAFLSGAIIMNSTIMELPSEEDGRFLPFMAGGLVYSLILLPLG